MNSPEEKLSKIDWEAFLDELPDFEIGRLLQDSDETPPSVTVGAAADDDNNKNNHPVLCEIENLLMDDAENDVVFPETPSSESDYDKLLADILVEPEGQRPKTESDEGSDKDRVVDASTRDKTPHEPPSKKLRRQLRNRDAAVRSRERKKQHVKDLEMKSRYYEGECRRLGHLLHCCYAENHALRLCLQLRGAFDASMTMQESAVLLLEPLLLGSLLWLVGIMCQLSLPLMLWLTAVLPIENIGQKDLRRVTQKGPESKISEYFQMQSFLKSRRCRASKTKMKFSFLML
ncbi:hypothetical protein RJT34_24076 [Clitoria ternatea]|uniref:BZIP domain-containing protein n=1 Tax=Clitoria ternatea TaxID=43366 RepID=A0AAN9FVR5_CLITE